MTLLPYKMIRQSMGFCRVTTAKVMNQFCFLWIYFSFCRVFFIKNYINPGYPYFLFVTSSFSLGASDKTTS